MKKAPEAFRTISEVSDLLDTPAHVLRFWESKFYQIRPVKRAGGRRYYRPDDVALLAGIRLLLQDQGITIRGVQKVLQEQGVRHVASLAPDLVALDMEGEAEDDAPIKGPQPTPRAIAARPASAPVPRAPLPLRDPEDVDTEFSDDAEEDFGSPEPAEPDDFVAVSPSPLPPAKAPRGPYDGFPEPASSDRVTPDHFKPGVQAREAADEGIGIDQGADEADIAPPPTRSAPPPEKRATGSVQRGAVPGAPDLLAGDGPAKDERTRLAQVLRATPRNALAANRGKAELIARRIDALLDRMSEASGAGRW